MSLDRFPAGSDLLPSDARRLSRAVSRHAGQTQLRNSKIDSETDVALARMDADTAATANAMGKVVQVAQGQRALELLAPETAGRLNLLSDRHALAMAEVLDDLRRQLRRW